MALTTVGSIGSARPHHDTNGQRIKGMCTELVRNQPMLEGFVRRIRHAEEMSYPSPTRTTFRVFASQGLFDGAYAGYAAEARIPLPPALFGEKVELVYFGKNAKIRRASPEYERLEREALGTILANSPISREAALGRVARNGYSISRLEGELNGDASGLVKLYTQTYQAYMFEITASTIQGMLSNGNIMLVARDSNSTIVSVMVAEHCEIDVSGRTIQLFEMSDYATAKEHRGNGLMTAMQIEAMKRIRETYPNAVIYTETRAPWRAVNISAVHAGLMHCGTLSQHCIIRSDRDVIANGGNMEDLHVFTDTNWQRN